MWFISLKNNRQSAEKQLFLYAKIHRFAARGSVKVDRKAPYSLCNLGISSVKAGGRHAIQGKRERLKLL